MNNSHDPIDRPEGETPEHGSDASRPPLPGEGSALPQMPFTDGQQSRQHAIGGASANDSPGGGGMLAAEIVGLALWALASFVIVYWLTGILDVNAWIPIVVWLLTGLIVIWPGSDGFVAKFLLGLRRPTMVESQRLAPTWYAVANRAGVNPNAYTVWIQGAETPTVSVTGGNTVSVTRWALYTLPPRHLEAALAHGLAVHRRGGSWMSRVLHWYSVPARVFGLALRLLLTLSRTIPAVGCTIIGFLLVAYLGIFLASLVFYDSLAVPLLFLLPLFSPLLFVGEGKFAERMADHATADLGYGRQLLEIFYGWQAQHEGGHRRGGLVQSDWLAGQPSVAERIRALEVYLQGR
jgi:hypothetical protein